MRENQEKVASSEDLDNTATSDQQSEVIEDKLDAITVLKKDLRKLFELVSPL